MTHLGPAKERGTSKATQASDEEGKKRPVDIDGRESSMGGNDERILSTDIESRIFHYSHFCLGTVLKENLKKFEGQLYRHLWRTSSTLQHW